MDFAIRELTLPSSRASSPEMGRVRECDDRGSLVETLVAPDIC